MIIISDTTQFHIDAPTAVAIGKFDGIHSGHVKLLNHILDYAVENAERGVKTAVFTFNMSAAKFFGDKDIKEVTTLSEKRLIFEEMGIDYLLEFPLNEKTAAIEATDFVNEIVLGMMNAEYIAAGEDVSFGYKGRGDAKLLLSLSDNQKKFKVDIIDKLLYEGRDISSTFVREEIAKGHMEVVSELLGHPYAFAGEVATGFKLGRKMGFPTMNLYPDPEKILPPLGVYYSNVIYEDANYPGITNIGIRPTVKNEADDHISVETYLFDFDKDMYGKQITTELIKFKRGEVKFDSVQELKQAIAQDICEGREFFGC